MSLNDYRILEGDQLRLQVMSSLATSVQAQARILYDDGNKDMLLVPSTTTGASRAVQNFDSGSSRRARSDGFVVSAFANHAAAPDPKRGQTYANLYTLNPDATLLMSTLARGYLYLGGGISLGQDDEALSGRGHLRWVQEANDVAGNLDTAIVLAAAGARRKVHAILVKYHSSGDVATRTLLIHLRDIADTSGPTGFSINADGWRTPQISMTQNEEGLVFVKEGTLVTNDNGSVTRDDSAQGNPFPFWVTEDDTTDLVVDIGSGESADDYDAWVQYEEWIEV